MQVVTSVCPANGEPIARVVTGSLVDYRRCVAAAEEAWQVGSGLNTTRHYW